MVENPSGASPALRHASTTQSVWGVSCTCAMGTGSFRAEASLLRQAMHTQNARKMKHSTCVFRFIASPRLEFLATARVMGLDVRRSK